MWLLLIVQKELSWRFVFSNSFPNEHHVSSECLAPPRNHADRRQTRAATAPGRCIRCLSPSNICLSEPIPIGPAPNVSRPCLRSYSLALLVSLPTRPPMTPRSFGPCPSATPSVANARLLPRRLPPLTTPQPYATSSLLACDIPPVPTDQSPRWSSRGREWEHRSIKTHTQETLELCSPVLVALTGNPYGPEKTSQCTELVEKQKKLAPLFKLDVWPSMNTKVLARARASLEHQSHVGTIEGLRNSIDVTTAKGIDDVPSLVEVHGKRDRILRVTSGEFPNTHAEVLNSARVLLDAAVAKRRDEATKEVR